MKKKSFFSVPHYVLKPFFQWFADSRLIGILIVLCCISSLLCANVLPCSQAYVQCWQRPLVTAATSFHWPITLADWINDGLMTLFFLWVGLDIKKEIVQGQLSTIQQAMMPIMAAVGGMIVPACMYFVINASNQYAQAWGIPMATDIAFSLGILSLLGNKIPLPVKIFLAAFAIIDDLGAILVIAVWYAKGIHIGWLLLTAFCAILFYGVTKLKGYAWLLIVLGFGCWLAMLQSGVHATLAGVMIAFLCPLATIDKLEHALHKFVNYGIVPLFVLCNTAFSLSFQNNVFANQQTASMVVGIMLALILGKPIGIVLATRLCQQLNLGKLHASINTKLLWGIGLLGGAGFTMSMFMCNLSFQQPALLALSKMAVLVASAISALLGYVWLKKSITKQ